MEMEVYYRGMRTNGENKAFVYKREMILLFINYSSSSYLCLILKLQPQTDYFEF